jgi:hypothetical protein
MNSIAATIATAMPAAILPTALFFGGGGTTKLFGTPHIGHEVSEAPYRLPHTEQSIQESI